MHMQFLNRAIVHLHHMSVCPCQREQGREVEATELNMLGIGLWVFWQWPTVPKASTLGATQSKILENCSFLPWLDQITVFVIFFLFMLCLSAFLARYGCQMWKGILSSHIDHPSLQGILGPEVLRNKLWNRPANENQPPRNTEPAGHFAISQY